MTTLINNNDIAASLYSDILDDLPKKPELPSVFLVQHIVPNNLPLFEALADHLSLAALIPKGTPQHGFTKYLVEQKPQRYNFLEVKRDELDQIADDTHGLPIPAGKKPFVILDVGGYFHQCAPVLSSIYGKRLLGIIEDTENGHQKYEKAYRRNGATTDYPVFSVARSPLKEPEDFLVGQAIVYSAESIIRENYSLLTNRQVLVIGYGKIGRSIAASLVVRNISVWVWDVNPIKRAQAMSHGFPVPKRSFAIRNAGVVFGATGRKSLRQADFEKLGKHTFVASVTSADDEFDLSALDSSHRLREEATNVTICYPKSKGNIFYLMRGGNAVNFAHSNALGAYIYLVQLEILHCLRRLVTAPPGGPHEGIYELSTAERKVIAKKWIDKFGRVIG